MNAYIVYECEQCGKRSEDKNDILSCEAKHLGLTVTERDEWLALKENVRHWTFKLKYASNNYTIRECEKAKGELQAFMEKHNMK